MYLMYKPLKPLRFYDCTSVFDAKSRLEGCQAIKLGQQKGPHMMLNKLIMALTLASALSACGDVYLDGKKLSSNDAGSGGDNITAAPSSPQTAAPATDAGKTTAAKPWTPEPTHGTLIGPDGVAVDIHITVKDGKPTYADVPYSWRPAFIFYGGIRKTWDQAVEQTPVGYHMATRAEALDLLDTKAIDFHDQGQAQVWTSTENGVFTGGAKGAIFVDLQTGASATSQKALGLFAFYVRDPRPAGDAAPAPAAAPAQPPVVEAPAPAAPAPSPAPSAEVAA